jgi:hypothetical protein
VIAAGDSAVVACQVRRFEPAERGASDAPAPGGRCATVLPPRRRPARIAVVARFDSDTTPEASPEGDATLKTFKQVDGHVWLLPENLAYDPIPGDRAKNRRQGRFHLPHGPLSGRAEDCSARASGHSAANTHRGCGDWCVPSRATVSMRKSDAWFTISTPEPPASLAPHRSYGLRLADQVVLRD